MTTLVRKASPSAGCTDQPPGGATRPDCLLIDLSQLQAGLNLESPIYDERGVLLLSAGPLTELSLQGLKRRGLLRVQASFADAAAVCARRKETRIGGESLAQLLDQEIQAHELFDERLGQDESDRVVLSGCNGYDPSRRQELLQNHREAALQLGSLMDQAAKGQAVSPNAIVMTAAQYLADLTADIDSVMATATQVAALEGLGMHCLRMSVFGMAIAARMGADATNVRRVGIAGMLHDWGLTRVPAEILAKKGAWSHAEKLEYRKHPIHSLEMIQHIRGIDGRIPLICYQVHEQPNGEGYPRRRTLSSIHPLAHVLAVADAYVTLTSRAPQRPPLLPYSALCIIRDKAHRGILSTDCVAALISIVGRYPVGSFVGLNDGSLAQVLNVPAEPNRSPLVRLVLDTNGCPMENPPTLDLSESKLEIAIAVPEPGTIAVERDLPR